MILYFYYAESDLNFESPWKHDQPFWSMFVDPADWNYQPWLWFSRSSEDPLLDKVY